MSNLDIQFWMLVAAGGLIMATILVKGIGHGALLEAEEITDERRKRESQQKADNAAAEAYGKVAGTEPLALNSDGTVEEPIVAMAESR